jgi:Carboxypeptidase regulatory-like domain
MKRTATTLAPWLALFAFAGCQRVREPSSSTNTQPRDAGAPSSRDASSAAVEGPTGTLEGVVSITAPIPPPRPITDTAETLRRPGCTEAATRYYANVFGVTEPGVMPEAIVTVDAHTTVAAAPRRRYAFFRDCHIAPRILAMTLGDELFLRAETNEHHLPKVDGLGATIAQLLNRGEDQQKFIQRPGRYILHSVNYPNWMQAPLVVTPNSFYDQTDREGHYRIEHVPVGTYTAHAWFPGTTPVNISVTVRSGEVTTQNFSITPLPADQIRPPQSPVIDAGPVIP